MAELMRRNEDRMSPFTTSPWWSPSWSPSSIFDALARWEPFRQVAPLASRLAFVPQFDVSETKDAYVFKADLPGVKEEDVDISLRGNVLSVTGNRSEEERREDEHYYSVERSSGSFTRSFSLPDGCDRDRVQANLNKGVLTITLAKTDEVRPRRISLKGITEGLKEVKERVSEKLKT